jgi:hypothetical protein
VGARVPAVRVRARGYTFEQALDLFLAEVGGRTGVEPWQMQQAADAVRIYRYQYRGASDDGEGGSPAAGRRGGVGNPVIASAPGGAEHLIGQRLLSIPA